MKTNIRKIGNSLGNIIPAAFIRELELEEGREVDITSENGKIIIAPIDTRKKYLPFSEAELLASLTAHTAHADELAILSSQELGE
jgi:antitoxin MazE